MNDELRSLLITLATGGAIGAVIGLTLRFACPGFGSRWKDFARPHLWKLFAFGAVLFGVCAIVLWRDGRVYHAAVSLALFVLEVVSLYLYGFRSARRASKTSD